jgi:hypothetical protein
MLFLVPALTLLFVTLKVTGYLAWSWLWVLSPLWIGIPLILLFVCFSVWAFSRVVKRVIDDRAFDGWDRC